MLIGSHSKTINAPKGDGPHIYTQTPLLKQLGVECVKPSPRWLHIQQSVKDFFLLIKVKNQFVNGENVTLFAYVNLDKLVGFILL